MGFWLRNLYRFRKPVPETGTTSFVVNMWRVYCAANDMFCPAKAVDNKIFRRTKK